jgi:hypothetical protein
LLFMLIPENKGRGAYCWLHRTHTWLLLLLLLVTACRPSEITWHEKHWDNPDSRFLCWQLHDDTGKPCQPAAAAAAAF